MDIFCAGRGLPFDKVPAIVQRRSQDVHPAIRSDACERASNSGLRCFQRHLGEPEVLFKVRDANSNVDITGRRVEFKRIGSKIAHNVTRFNSQRPGDLQKRVYCDRGWHAAAPPHIPKPKNGE